MLKLVPKLDEQFDVEANRIRVTEVAMFQAVLQRPCLRLTIHLDHMAALIEVVILDAGTMELGVQQVVPCLVHVCNEVAVAPVGRIPLVHCLKSMTLRLHEHVMPARSRCQDLSSNKLQASPSGQAGSCPRPASAPLLIMGDTTDQASARGLGPGG